MNTARKAKDGELFCICYKWSSSPDLSMMEWVECYHCKQQVFKNRETIAHAKKVNAVFSCFDCLPEGVGLGHLGLAHLLDVL